MPDSKLQTVSCQNLYFLVPHLRQEPLIISAFFRPPYSFPFSRRRHQGGARWDSPSGQGRRVLWTGSRKPEGGQEDVFRGAERTRRAGNMEPLYSSKRTSRTRRARAGTKPGWASLSPWAGASSSVGEWYPVLPSGRCSWDQSPSSSFGRDAQVRGGRRGPTWCRRHGPMPPDSPKAVTSCWVD